MRRDFLPSVDSLEVRDAAAGLVPPLAVMAIPPTVEQVTQSLMQRPAPVPPSDLAPNGVAYTIIVTPVPGPNTAGSHVGGLIAYAIYDPRAGGIYDLKP